MNKSVIFDMDGTLFKTDEILEISLEDTFQYLRAHGEWSGETPIALYRDIMGVPLPEVWAALLPDHSIEQRAIVDKYFLEQLITNIKNDKGALYDHVFEVMEKLKQRGYTLFIASNGLVKYLEAIVEHYHLGRYIYETYSIEQISSLQKSELVKQIVNKHNIEEGAMVGDRLSDILAAKDNSLLAIGCNFDFAKAEELMYADIVIDNMNELLDILK